MVPTSQSAWVSFLKRLSIWLPALALACLSVLLRDLPQLANQADFSHYYVSALMMRQGFDPYTTNLRPLAESIRLNVADINIGTYPPTFMLCFEPLTLLPPLPAYWLWIAMNVLFLAIALYLLLDGLPTDTDLRLALVALAILYFPISDNICYAQTQILILLLLILFIRWVGAGRDALAGSILALAGLLKVFPIILIGYLLLRRLYKPVIYTAVASIAGGVVTLALVGVDRSLHFVQALPFLTSRHWLSSSYNVALGAMVSRLFWWIGVADPRVEFARRVAVVMAELALFALTARATLRSSKLSDRSDERIIALWVVTAVLLSPTAWIHYLVLLLIPYAVLTRERLRGAASLVAARLGIASYLMAEVFLVLYMVAKIQGKTALVLPPFARLAVDNVWPLCVLLAYGAAYSLAVETIPHAAPTSKAARSSP